MVGKPLIFFLLFIVPLINCTLKVAEPKDLAESFEKKNINYTIGNFGHIPYGKTLIGTAFLANPLTACSTIDPPISKNARIIVIKRGDCSFVTKVKFAQMVGVKLAIIVDNLDEDSDRISMKDDGFGSSVQIPALFINKEDGQKLIRALNSTEANEKNVVLSVSFDMFKTDQRLKYIFWLSTSNRNSFKLVKDFMPNYLRLKPYADFEPHYAIWTCSFCALSDYKIGFDEPSIKNDCISNGRYCSPDTDGDNPGKGGDIVMEDLRQICIFKNFPDAWWFYMNKFDQECTEIQLYNQCSKTIQERVHIDTKIIEDCVEKSFTAAEGTKPNYQSDDNAILKQERSTFLDKSVLFWPSVHIGLNSYLGNLEADEILEAICATFYYENPVCHAIDNPEPNGSQANVALIIVIVIALVLVFIICLAFLYKRFIKKEISKEMSTQVNEMVSQYISLYENRGNVSKNTN